MTNPDRDHALEIQIFYRAQHREHHWGTVSRGADGVLVLQTWSMTESVVVPAEWLRRILEGAELEIPAVAPGA